MNLFDLAYGVGAAVLSPIWARKARGGWRERFGHVTCPPKPEGRKRLLLHAVSVGEVNALRTLVPMLRESCDVVVSASTDTGLARARQLFEAGGPVVRYPLDFSKCVRRFIDAVRPDAVGLVELEVWPNFVRECERRGVPVGVVNGRLSARSFKGYRKAKLIIGPTFRRLAFAAVQDRHYADRFIAMGMAKDRVSITDTMKWDSALEAMRTIESGGTLSPDPDELARQMGIDRSRPLVVAGSTAEDEERLLHESCPPGVQLLCAPRKPERFDAAAAAMPGCTRRSQARGEAKRLTAAGTVRTPTGLGSVKARDRFLLDSIGELRSAYALADIVVMGRSFGNLYGSDPLEAVGLGKAVVTGPRFGDFLTVTEALREAGAIRVANGGELQSVLSRLLADTNTRQIMASKGKSCILTHAGATKRHADLLLGLLQ